MCRSNVSHGAIVPSGRTSKLASAPADPGLGPVLVRRPDVGLDLGQRATGQPRRREDLTACLPVGEDAAGLEPAAVDAHDARGSSSGGSRASSTATLPPQDWPATIGRSSASVVDEGCEVVRHGRDVVAARRASRNGRDRAGRPSRRGVRRRPGLRRRRPTCARSRRGRGPGRRPDAGWRRVRGPRGRWRVPPRRRPGPVRFASFDGSGDGAGPAGLVDAKTHMHHPSSILDTRGGRTSMKEPVGTAPATIRRPVRTPRADRPGTGPGIGLGLPAATESRARARAFARRRRWRDPRRHDPRDAGPGDRRRAGLLLPAR